MKEYSELLSNVQNHHDIMQESIPWKMFLANIICCSLGAAIMAFTVHYLLMGVFIAILVSMGITTPLHRAGKISTETACLVPMLLLCFVYTPISWFTFDGLMGCTPYQTILFASLVIMTYYRRIQTLLLASYAALVFGLTLHSLTAYAGRALSANIINNLTAYVITATLIIFFLINIQKRNKEISRNMMDHSIRDGLTGLYNRRVLERILDIAEKRYASGKTDYIIMMLDIDRFKSINDKYGHNMGDSVLKSLAECIQNGTREKDYAVRFGGDEFIIIFSEMNRESGQQISGQIKAALREISGYAFPVTVSTGCALRSECAARDEAIALADQRMYEVKRRQWEEETFR